MTYKLFILLLAVAFAAAGKHDKYSRSSIYAIKIQDESDKEFLFKQSSDLDLDIWSYGVPSKGDAEVLVKPEYKQMFLEAIEGRGLEYNVKIEDLAKVLEEDDARRSRWNAQRIQTRVFEKYPRVAEINEYLEKIAADYPNIVSIVDAGKSTEERDIKYLKISTTNFEDSSKPIYLMLAMVHAREWVTAPVALYSIHRLVENLRDEDKDLLDNIDWIIVPMVNPDGYEYSHTGDRLWRKTRSINPYSEVCIGVDANRNFDAFFNTVGVSSNPCSLVYPGWKAFSEPETRHVRDIMHEYASRIEILMDIHSFGSYVLFPNGNGSMPPTAPRLHHLSAAMGAAIDALKLPQANYYAIGNAGQLLYPTSGDTTDYGQKVGIPFPYTLEITDFGFGFLVPEEFIDQINMESWEGIAASARIARLYYLARPSQTN